MSPSALLALGTAQGPTTPTPVMYREESGHSR